MTSEACLGVSLHLWPTFDATGLVSSNPARVTVKTQLLRKATGNHLMNCTSLGKDSEHCLWSLLHSKSSMLNAIDEEGKGKPPHQVCGSLRNPKVPGSNPALAN